MHNHGAVGHWWILLIVAGYYHYIVVFGDFRVVQLIDFQGYPLARIGMMESNGFLSAHWNLVDPTVA